MEILMNNVDHVFCLFVFFSFLFFFKFFNTPQFFFYMFAILYKALTISMIQLELAVVFLFSQSMYILTICFMYATYLLFNYALYIFVHIFTGVEMLCLFVYQLLIDLSCVFICNLDILDNG
jgi:hypothetical protein